ARCRLAHFAAPGILDVVLRDELGNSFDQWLWTGQTAFAPQFRKEIVTNFAVVAAVHRLYCLRVNGGLAYCVCHRLKARVVENLSEWWSHSYQNPPEVFGAEGRQPSPLLPC